MPQCAISSCTNSYRKAAVAAAQAEAVRRSNTNASTTGTTTPPPPPPTITEAASATLLKSPIRYHRFPSDALTRSEWLRVCGKNNVNVDTARVCSLHFSPLSYKNIELDQNNIDNDNDNNIDDKEKVVDNNRSIKLVKQTRKYQSNVYKSRLKKGVIPHLNINHNIIVNNNIKSQRQRHKLIKKHNKINNNKLLKKEFVYNNNQTINHNSKYDSKNISNENVCDWLDKEYPLLYALHLIPNKQLKLPNQHNTINVINRMLVMEETEIQPNQNNSSTTDDETSTKIESQIKDIKIPATEEDNNTSLSINEIKPEELKIVDEIKNKNEADNDEKIVMPTTTDCEIVEEEKLQKRTHDESNTENNSTSSLPKKIKLKEKGDDTPPASTESIKCDTLDDIEALEIKLISEIEYLDQLARRKEREWNSLIHAKKIKEEQMLRLQRKRQVTLITQQTNRNGNTVTGPDSVDWELALDLHIRSLNQIHNKNSRSQQQQPLSITDNGVTIQPISNIYKTITRSNQPSQCVTKESQFIMMNNSPLIQKQRNILPKTMEFSGNSSRTGPKGQPMMDVNLIVEKFRQSNPAEVPRRGKRIRDHRSLLWRNDIDTAVSSSTSNKILPILNVNNNGNSSKIAISSSNNSDNSAILQSMPKKVDVNSELGMLLSTNNENVRVRGDNDSSHSSESVDTVNEQIANNGSAMSFKDVLVEFARMTQNQQSPNSDQQNSQINLTKKINNTHNTAHDIYNNITAKSMQSFNCPEVTLHPVVENDRSQIITSNSLLHGILTKNKPTSSGKPFLSPTLARLLTDTSSQPSDVSNITDLLANNQLRTGQSSPNSRMVCNNNSATIKLLENNSSSLSTFNNSLKSELNVSKVQYTNDVINLDDVENDDSLDRLVIDESRDNNCSATLTRTTKTEMNSGNDAEFSTITHNTKQNPQKNSQQVPICQGCKKNASQFVCAGCTSRWYCSRECQVSDWDQHCEICSG